jgi:UDP-N-acetylmuramyl tripeptide synthase
LPTTVLDSRRLTGPGLLLDGPGAVLDVRLEPADIDRAIAAWQSAAQRLLGEVGWPDQTLVSRRFPGGVTLALTAPADCLYSATELNERAWEAAAAALAGQPSGDYVADAAALRSAVEAERNPTLMALRREAGERRLTFLSGEDLVSVGSGTGVTVWPIDALPEPAGVDWSKAHDVPAALVTGSNGKTTVVRLLADMVRAAGRTPGYTSTDGVIAGTEMIGEGDFSGPSGARLVLRHSGVQTAILETARGGILRRGLAVERADAAVVTNVAEDHLGEFGIDTLAQLADTKLVVAKALGETGILVLNADDPMLVERGVSISAPITWFSLDPASPVVKSQTRAGATAIVVEAGNIVIVRGNQRTTVAPLDQVPITFGGTADHNVANVLAAVGVGAALGLAPATMATALRRFGHDCGDNPGRSNLFEFGGIRVLIDYAHNPHGMLALVRLAAKLPAKRRLMMLGQAGDRSDEAIRQLARSAWSLQPDHVIVKDMAEYLRGRAPGEVPALLMDEFARLGVDHRSISRAGPDIEGLRQALEWSLPGDLLVLAVHEDRREVVALLGHLKETGWRSGQPVPR